MRKTHRFLFAVFAAVFFSITSFSQSVRLSGSVRDSSNQQAVQAVSVTIKGSSLGTYTDANGNFQLTVPGLPVTLVVSSIGFEAQEVNVDNASAISIDFIPASSLGQEVVVSASRTPERILESPGNNSKLSTSSSVIPITPPTEKFNPGAWLSIPSTIWLNLRLPLPLNPRVLGVLNVNEEEVKSTPFTFPRMS
jgi:hypothetical protein